MRILQCIDSLDPALGGVVESTIQMAVALNDCGADTEILSLDGRMPAYHCEFGGPVHRVGPPYTPYGYAPGLSKWLKANLRRFDAVLVNGIWKSHSIEVPRHARIMGRPYFIIPHSALNPWFRDAFPLKHVKKSAFWRLFQHRAFRGAQGILFTSDEERELARGSFRPFACREVVLPLGTADPREKVKAASGTESTALPGLSGKRLFLFLGRLHPMKACDVLIRAWAEIAPGDTALHLVMAGPDDVGWRAALERLVGELKLVSSVSFVGPLFGQPKWEALGKAELMVLPSHCEAFPYSVLESLACGVPVLVSRRVNIHPELEDGGCGLVGDDTVEDTVRSFRRWLAMPPDAQQAMRTRSRRCFVERFSSQRAARGLIEFLNQELSGRNGAL